MIPMLSAAPRTSTDSPGAKRAWATPDHGVDIADADGLGGDQDLPVGGARVRKVDDGQASRRFAALAIQAFQVHISGAGLPHWGPDVQVGTVGGGPTGQPAFPVGDR